MPDQKRPSGNNDGSQDSKPDKSSHSQDMQFDQIRKALESHKFQNEEDVKKFLSDNLGFTPDLPDLASETPLEKAQQLVFEAWDAPTRKESVALARQALKISPDCADAYVILAEEYATSIAEAIYYYRAGVAAGERALGPELFKKLTGGFWADFRTRPYMRARAGLAECLWELGRQTEAIAHYQDMLKLNPADNQGIRYVLASCLVKLGNWAELKKVLSAYHESSAAWLFTWALIAFAEKGDCPASRLTLKMAVRYNRYVIPYLTGRKKVPRTLPEFVGFGDRKEAIYYASDFGGGWEETPGAVDWLKEVYPTSKSHIHNKKLHGIPDVFLEAFPEDDKK